MSKVLNNIFLIILIGFGLFQIGFSYEDQCIQDCVSSNWNDIVDRCMSDHGDEFIETCLFDGGQYAAITQYKDECFDSYGEDYAILFEGGMFFMSLDDFVDEVCDEFDFACQEEMRNEYDDAAYTDIGEAEQACIEDHWEDFGDDCLADFPGPAQMACILEYGDDYENTCLEDYGTENPSCGCEEDEAWIDELGMCLDEEQFICYTDGEHCQYDGDDWCSGYDVSGINKHPLASSDDCVDIEEAQCLVEGGYYDGGICVDESSDRATILCEDLGYYWSTQTSTCYDNEDAANCWDNNKYWSTQLETCYDNEEEGICNELGREYIEGICLNDEASECNREGKIYCENLNTCVIDETQCCESEENLVYNTGICVNNEDEANCLNNGNYWSEKLEECF